MTKQKKYHTFDTISEGEADYGHSITDLSLMDLVLKPASVNPVIK